MEFETDSADHKMLDDLFEAFMLTGRGEYVSLYDVKSQITRYSSAAAKIFGFPEYIHYGAYNWSEHIHPEDRYKYETVMTELIDGTLRNYDISYRVLLKDGSYISTRNIGAVIRDENDKPAFIGGIMINEGLVDSTDPITVLRNQYGFFQDLATAIELKKICTVLLIGVSKMNNLNNSLGYDYGNRVLQHLGWILQENFSLDGMVYRLDGAKFAFLTETLSPEEIAERYEKVRRSALSGLSVDNGRQVIVLNSGMITYDGNMNINERTLYSCLNLAFHNSKSRRGGRLVNYDGAFGKDIKKSVELVNEVRNSIVMECEGFNLRYQPIFSAEDEKIMAAEALLVWQNKKFGEVSPGAYIPAIERDFLFEELGYWIFRRAMIDGLKILEKNPDFVVNVNVAPAQVTDEFLIDELVKMSSRLKFPLKNLCFELTANCRQIEMNILQSVIFELKKLGVGCLIDDFGGGVASIDFLELLTPEFIKPEKKYIIGMENNSRNRCIVQHLTNMAAELGTNVCIKGVESKFIRDIVREFPIKSMQGNFYSKPMFIEELMQKYFPE